MIKERLRADCLQLQIPQIENDEFVGIIDVVSQKVLIGLWLNEVHPVSQRF